MYNEVFLKFMSKKENISIIRNTISALLLEKNPNNTEYLIALTNLYITEKKYFKARAILKDYFKRNPEEKEAFELAAMQHFKKTIPDKVEKFQNQLAVASIMIDMFQYMKQQNAT